MSKKRVFTVGRELPGEEFEHVDFNSDQTLLDADVILFEPGFGSYELDYLQQWHGKSILSEHSSFAVKARLDHWHSEIVAAVNAGKVVIVYLTKPIEYFRYTGERQYSGTGRNRVQANVVTKISSYEAVPNVKTVSPKSGNEIRLEKVAAYLASYWQEFSAISPYEVEIDGTFTKILLKSQAGNRTVGAALHDKSGVLLFLPPLRYDYEAFVRETKVSEDEVEEHWTDDALKFGKRLISVLIALTDVLKQASQVTPPPSWSLNSEFRLTVESELEAKISDCTVRINKLRAERTSIEKQLSEAGELRGLLFEQGKPLERIIIEAMKLMGFDAQPFNDGQSEFDGVFASSEGRCLGEAEGRDNKAIHIEKFSQLERNLQEDFARDEITEHAKGILFGNAFRLSPLTDRSEFFTVKCISAAKRIAAALIRTPDLFAPAKYLRENPSDADYATKCREAIFATVGGIVSFPCPPAAEAMPTVVEEQEPVTSPLQPAWLGSPE